MDNVNTLVFTGQKVSEIDKFLDNKYKAREIYGKLEGVETQGEIDIHKQAIGVVANKFNEIGTICAERGTTLIIDYDKNTNNFTLYEYPAKISSISEISQDVLNGKGKIDKRAVLNGKNIGNATFTFANESGTTFGSNRNVNFGFVDKDQSWKILPAAEAKLSMFVKYLQRKKDNVVTNRSFGSAMSVTTRQMNTPYNPKASGAQNEYRRLMQKTSGQNSISDLNYAAEDLARSKAVIISNLLQSASYSIDSSNKYLDQIWQITQWVIQGQNEEVVRASEAFKKIFSANPQKANQALQKIIHLKKQYSLQDIDLGIASENTQSTGSLGLFKTARNIEGAGAYTFKRPQGVQQAVSFYKEKDKKIYSRSPKRSTEAEKKAGLVRGRDVSYKEGDIRPEDAVVIVAEVSAADENIGKDTFLDDNVVVSKELLKQTAGSNELRVVLRNNQEKDINRIRKKMGKFGIDLAKTEDSQVYGALAAVQDETTKAEIYKQIWVEEARKKNRDWHEGDEKYNNITATIDENGNLVITGMEQRVGRWGDKIIGGPVKGSATKSDAALAYVRNRSGRKVQALFSTSKGNVRNVGPQEYQTALSALEGEYGTSLGLYYNGGQGAERAMELIGKVASNKNETKGQQMAAKVLQSMYSASDGGFQTNKNLFEAIEGLYTEEKDQVLALKSILPLIDRLINGIDKSNELMSYENYNKIDDKNKYYHVDPTTGDVSRTTKDLITFLNLHGPGEYKWGGLNVSGAKETLRRSMTMAATANGIENADKAINEVVDSLDIESDKLREFTELQNKAKASIEETSKTAQLSRQGTDSVLKSGWQGDVGNSDYVVVIKPNADDKNVAEIDLSSIKDAEWDNGKIQNEDQILKGRLLNKLAELDSSGVDKNRVKFVIDSGKGFGGVDSKGNRWGGNALYVPQGFTGDEQYFNELSYLVSLIQSGEDENITNSQYKDVLLQILQDFQNKGSVYNKYHDDPTKGVMPTKFLSMPINWLRKAFEDGGIPQGDKLSQFQADVATQGMFISNGMFWKQAKELTDGQIDELYDKIFEGFDGDDFDRTGWSRSKKLEKIRSALTYNENPNSLFGQVLNKENKDKEGNIKGNFDEGTILQLLFRSPFVSALAGKTIRKVFINSNLSGSDAVMLNPGAAAAIDADYDGDQGGIRSGWHYSDEAKELLNLTAKSEEELNKKLSFYKLQSVMSDAGYQWKDGRFQTVEKGKIKIIDDETAKTLFDKNISDSAAVLSRAGRGNIGKLSNLSSEFRNMLKDKGYDEIGLSQHNTPDARQSIYSGMIGRVFLQALEQDAISSKKIINRMMKLRGDNRGVESLSEDELQKEYKKSVEVVDKILDDFYSGQINFDGENGLLSSLQKIGVLEEDGSLKSNAALQSSIEFIHRQSGGDEFLKKIFGNDISFDDKDLGTDKYYFAQNLSSQGIKNVFEDVSQNLGTNTNDLLRSLPGKEHTPEKQAIKDKNISTRDLKNVDKTWLDHVKTLNQAEEASVSEAQAESNKIIIAGKEAKAIEALSKQYNILADSVDEANNKQFLTGHSIANSVFPLTIHKKIGEEGEYNSEFYMARGSYVSDLATFGEGNDRTKQSRARYEAALESLYKDETPEEKKAKIDAAFSEAAEWADKFREQIKDETLGLTNTTTYGETKLTAQSDNNQLLGVADVIKVGDEGAVIIEQKTSKTNKITGNQIAQVRSYQAMLENLRGLFGNFFESQGKGKFSSRNARNITHDVYEGLVDDFLKTDVIQNTYVKKLKDDDLKQLKSVLIDLFESGGGMVLADGTQLWDKPIRIKVNLVDDSGKIHTYEDTNSAGYKDILQKLLDEPWNITDRDAALLTAGTYGNEGADGTLNKKKSRGNKRRVSSSRKKFDRVAEIEKVLKQREKLLEEQYNLTQQRDGFQQGSDEYQSYDFALGAVNSKITKLDESFNKLNTFKASGKLKSKTDFKQETRDAIDGLQKQYEAQYKVFRAQKEAAEQRKKERDEQSQLNNALSEYERTLKAVTKYEQIQKSASQKANLSTGRARTTQLQIAQDAATLAERYRSQQRSIESSDIYKNNQKEFVNVFGDWLLTNELAESQTEGQNRGARNIFDVIGDDVKRAFRRITDFGVAARILNKVQREIANVYQNILKLNEAMTDIRIVTGASVDEANSLMTSYNKLAKELGTTTTEVAKSASEWMRQGYSASESVNLITSSVKLARLGFMDMSSATTSLTAVLKGFNLQATESSEIVDKLTKLDAEYATTAGDIATALSRTAAAAKAANLDLDQTASMITTIIDITQQDAGSVGNALKTILSRYGNVKAGVFAGMEEDGEDASESINDVEKVLNAIGIQIRSTSTEMRGFDEVLDDLAEKWDNLNDVEQNAVATAMAGVRQRNQFLALMQNYDQYKESLESSRTSSGTADEKYAAVMDSIATSMQRIQTAWESFTQKLQASGFVKGFFKAIAGVVENIDKILPGIVTMLININAKHLPVLGMKIKSLFGTRSAAANWFKGSFGGSKTLVEQQLLEKAKYRVSLVGEEGLTPEERAILNGSKGQQPKSYTEELLKQIADNTAGIKRNTSKDGDDQNFVPDDLAVDVRSGNKPSLIKRFGKSFGRNLKTYGIISGIGAGISAGMTANYGDFTSGVDKAVTGVASGVATGLLSAIPVAGPLLGSIFGPLIGDWVGKKFYNEFHKEEIARRARVDEAKKQLEATQKVESAITSAEELTSKDRSEWGSEEYKQEKELIDQMRLGLQTSSSLAENFAKLSGESTEASDWIIQLSKGLTQLNESVVENYRAALLLTEAQETYKAGEEDRAALYDKLGSAEASMLNQIQNMDSASSEYLEKRKEYESKYGKTVESGIASMQQAQMQLDAFTDALHEGYMKAAFYSSGVSQMSSTDIAGASLDRVVAEVARAWAASDVTALVFANGTLLDSARKQIVAYLKTQSDFVSLTKSPGGSLRDIMDARDEIGLYLQKTGGDYEKLKNIVNQQDFKKIREFFGYDAENTENDPYIKDLIDQINKADPSNIELIAHGINMTVEQAESLKNVIGSISLEDILNGADKLLDKFETLNEILGDISEDTILSPENMNKVVSTFPDLFKEFDENGNFTGDISSENIIGNLAKLVTDPNGALATAYAGLTAKESLTDQNKWKIFQDSVKANKKVLDISDEQLSDIMTAKDFNSQAQLMLNNEKLMAEWAKIVAETTAVADYAEQARNILIEAENKSLEKQIDNLQSIKDSIGDINKQREKELDLIKARDALENAKKEKKLVYRAGIGFVATSDSSAIQEAQDKVDELERQQTQEDLQYQIDQLNQQKSILEAIQNDPNIESIKNSAEEIKDALSKGGDGTVLGYLQTLSTDTFVSNIKDAILESIKENTADAGKEEYKSELETYNKMVSDYDDLLNSKYKDSNLSYQDILNDPSSVYYSDVKNIIEGKQNQITEQYQKTKELQKQYFSENPTEEELAGYGGLSQKTFEKLEQAQDIILLNLNGAGDEFYGYTTAWLTKEEVSEDEFKSGGQFYKWNHALAKTPGGSWRTVSSADEVKVGDILINDDYKNKLAYRGADGKFYWIRTRKDPESGEFGSQGDIFKTVGAEDIVKYAKGYSDQIRAKGDYDYIGGKVLINELGTEAIVTPQGTLTSLPSHSGIVPADLTKNLFSLGEIAPNLIATLRNQMPNVSKSNSTSNDNSTNIGTVYATFNADSGFDMNRFMIDLRSAAGNTRHNN